MVNVFWPAFEWGPMNRPHERYLSFSYSANLTVRDNRRFRDLRTSPEYQALWGDRVTLRNDAVHEVLNVQSGWKIASSVGGTATGQRGSRVLLDDPHSISEAESEVVRTETVRWFREAMSNRLQDLNTDAIIIIMQRVHAGDVSGEILDNELPYCNLCIPMEFESDRATDEQGEPRRTMIGWSDPRCDDGVDGALAWAERFPADVCEKMKKEGGPYAWAAQYQQSPAPRGGGLIKRSWWELWPDTAGKMFPSTSYRVASLDGAFGQKESSDPSGFSVWGVFSDPQTKQNRAILMSAWSLRLPLHGEPTPRLEHEIKRPGDDVDVAKMKDRLYRQRAGAKWGLVEKVRSDCLHYGVSALLVENKASGFHVVQELQRLYQNDPFQIWPINPKGDKTSRVMAVIPYFANGWVYAPNRTFAEQVITECENFPRHRTDDLVDSTTMALLHLRERGLLKTGEEYQADEYSEGTHRGRLRSLYGIGVGGYLPPIGGSVHAKTW
jgi:predicted phage terminase large subunit-like protein